MRLVVATEARFYRDASGAIRAEPAGPGYGFWTRYLGEFDEVSVLARVCDRTIAGPPVEGPGVDVAALPDFIGLPDAVRRGLAVRRRARLLTQQADEAAFLARVPGTVGGLMIAALADRYPFGLEVIGDPYEIVPHLDLSLVIRSTLREVMKRRLRRQCRDATAVAYQTRETLQRRYPHGPDAFACHYTDAVLAGDAYVEAPRSQARRNGLALRLVTVGTQSQLYKGHDVLIDAVQLLWGRGVPVDLGIVGDGSYRSSLEERAAAGGSRLGAIQFHGQLPSGAAVRAQLDKADLFVLPSRTEGLPRALIEAQARALPCIASSVGGIPELLNAGAMVSPGDPVALADRLQDVMSDPDRMLAMSARNLDVARGYREGDVEVQRRLLYSVLRERTAAWLRSRDEVWVADVRKR